MKTLNYFIPYVFKVFIIIGYQDSLIIQNLFQNPLCIINHLSFKSSFFFNCVKNHLSERTLYDFLDYFMNFFQLYFIRDVDQSVCDYDIEVANLMNTIIIYTNYYIPETNYDFDRVYIVKLYLCLGILMLILIYC